MHSQQWNQLNQWDIFFLTTQQWMQWIDSMCPFFLVVLWPYLPQSSKLGLGFPSCTTCVAIVGGQLSIVRIDPLLRDDVDIGPVWWFVSTQLKNMRKSNLDHFPRVRGKNKKCLKSPPPRYVFYVIFLHNFQTSERCHCSRLWFVFGNPPQYAWNTSWSATHGPPPRLTDW